MKKSILKGFLLILLSSTCFACTNGIENLVDAGIPIIDSSPALVADVKASSNLLGWGNVGDTTIRVKADKDVLPALSITLPDLKAITSNIEGGFRLLSVGGSISVGFRDGGLYREGQLTAFPNLVARQMGVKFNQPLFDATEGNGSGYKVLEGTEPIATFKLVTNNLGYVDNNKADNLKKFNGSNIGQYAFPFAKLNFAPINSEYIKYNGKIFSDRIFNNPNKADYQFNWNILKSQSCDFFIFETGWDQIISDILTGNGGGINPLNPFDETPELQLIQAFVDNKAKGVLLNVPDMLDFPYFNQFTEDKLKKAGLTGLKVQESSSSTRYRDFNFKTDKIIPTAKTEKLFTGQFRDVVELSDFDVLSNQGGDMEWLRNIPTPYNEYVIQRKAKAANLPVADIYGLYKKIMGGTYITDDSVKVNPDWKTGNFFSADGIYPTAFGQAVITNEVIKTINQYYKLAIPLVDTRFFLKK